MQPKLENQTSDLSLEGLEGLLDSAESVQKPEPHSTAGSVDANNQDWTVEETARALGLSRGAVIRRLEDGILTGYRLKRSYGWVWRVKPSWLAGVSSKNQEAPSNDAIADSAETKQVDSANQTKTEPASNTASSDFVEVFDVCEESANLPAIPDANYKELIELRAKLQMAEFQFQDTYKKLETANYKIGYLEAKLEVSQDQLKVIGDSQAKQPQPWYRRWFK